MEQLQNTWNIVCKHISFMMFLWLPWGLTTTQNSISLKAQDRIWIGLVWPDTRSAENDWIGADTDPRYRIDASLLQTGWLGQEQEG